MSWWRHSSLVHQKQSQVLSCLSLSNIRVMFLSMYTIYSQANLQQVRCENVVPLSETAAESSPRIGLNQFLSNLTVLFFLNIFVRGARTPGTPPRSATEIAVCKHDIPKVDIMVFHRCYKFSFYEIFCKACYVSFLKIGLKLPNLFEYFDYN